MQTYLQDINKARSTTCLHCVEYDFDKYNKKGLLLLMKVKNKTGELATEKEKTSDFNVSLRRAWRTHTSPQVLSEHSTSSSTPTFFDRRRKTKAYSQ